MRLPTLVALLLITIVTGKFNSHERQRRMIGGRAAKIEEWTFAASLEFLQNKPDWKVCTATVLNRWWLLTAAHCVDQILHSPKDLQVKIYSKQSKSVVTARKYGVQKIIPHSMYVFMQLLSQSNIFSWDFDVALLKLNETIVGDVAVVPIPDTKVAVEACRSAGWGSQMQLSLPSDVRNKLYNISDSLQEIDVPLVPWKECYDFRNGNHTAFAEINQHVFCGGDTSSNQANKQGGCIGDSGSPLICNTNRGLVFYGMLLGGNPLCSQDRDFMIFTDVAKYKPWIYEKTQLES